MSVDCRSHHFNILWYHGEKMWSINLFSMHNQLRLQTPRRFLREIFFPKHIYFFVVSSGSDLSFIITQQPMARRVNHYFYKTYRSSERSLVFHSSDRKSDAAIILSYRNFGAKWRITPSPFSQSFIFDVAAEATSELKFVIILSQELQSFSSSYTKYCFDLLMIVMICLMFILGITSLGVW